MYKVHTQVFIAKLCCYNWVWSNLVCDYFCSSISYFVRLFLLLKWNIFASSFNNCAISPQRNRTKKVGIRNSISWRTWRTLGKFLQVVQQTWCPWKQSSWTETVQNTIGTTTGYDGLEHQQPTKIEWTIHNWLPRISVIDIPTQAMI